MTPAWPDVTSGLVGHWKLDETSGTTAADSSGNSKDGTMTGGLNAATSTIKGAVGAALKFDGINDFIIEPNSFGLTGSTSVSVWFRKDDDGLSSNPQVFNFYLDNDTEWALVVDNSNQIEILDDTGGAEQFIYTTPIVQGRWYHAVAMMDGLENKLYLDGVLIGSGISAAMSNDGIGGDLFIGSKRSNWQFFNGAIDDVRIYNRALSLSEIQRLYAMGAPVGTTTALPQGCATVGQVCDDGTIYAGTYSSTPYFTTVADAGNMVMNNGNSSGLVDVSAASSDTDGRANTNTIAITDSDSATAGFQPHLAAQYCFTLNAHGADDWFLAARSEFAGSVCANRTVIPGISSNYWSSTDHTVVGSFQQVGSTCTFSGLPANNSRAVRCVRKGPAPRCANPYGLEGQLTYNVTHEVVQYCDGARWIAIGKSGP